MKISASFFAGMVALCVIASGCDSSLRQDMANQPKNRPLSPSEFFRDGRSERPLLENTVAHGAVDNDVYKVPKEYAGFPVPVDEKFLLRGEDRYKVFCTPCHGLQGDGNGMIAMRGMKHPPSYHIDRLRQAPNGYFYDVISNGFGAKTVADDVIKISVWRLTQSVNVIAGRMLHTAHGDHAVTVALQPVARRAKNFVTILSTQQKLFVYRNRKSCVLLRDVVNIIVYRAMGHGIFKQGALRTSVSKEFARRKRPILRLVGHILPQR